MLARHKKESTTSMSKVEIGQKYWTTCPTIHESILKGLDQVPPWEGEVVKIIGGSLWLVVLEACGDPNDPLDCGGKRTAIARIDELHKTVTEALSKEKP